MARWLRVVPGRGGLPGTVRRRVEVAPPVGYVVVDLETTGTSVESDEIVSLAVVRLDADGVELDRFASLVRPAGPIPVEATAVHGIDDASVARAPSFADLAEELHGLLDGAVFVAHNAGFDLPLLEHAFARAGTRYRPGGVACTLDAFRLLEPVERSHRLESLCERHGVRLDDAHDARGDVLATVALLRILLGRGIAPETVELDHAAYMRLRSRGDKRRVSEPQVRRVFALARAAGFVALDGTLDDEAVVALVERVSGVGEVEALTREQVQDVYDALELVLAEAEAAQAASA
ncbi:MAG TPA: 3'-5' exonuclease [Gaiella sp.]|nr:3'-5' exonuclease [Gaiella sp.]